jgi:sugar lactone lactonase YvrE
LQTLRSKGFKPQAKPVTIAATRKPALEDFSMTNTLRQAKWTCLHPTPYELGESPFWHPQESRWYWVDIPGKKILRAQADGTGLEVWDMPSEPGCIAPAAHGGLVIALRHGVFRAQTWGGALQHLVTLPYDTHTVRANDGKCDALGRFWVGTIDETKAQDAASLFCIDARSGAPVVQTMATGALTGNGMGWSLDGRSAYWADTPRHLVHGWDYEPMSNTLSAQRTHLQFDAKPADWVSGNPSYQGRPDGAAVDSQGNYWLAMFEGARICCFSQQGQLLACYATPAQCPTMPCFGGEDLKTLFITSARHGRKNEELQRYPDSGCVFSMRVDVPGLPVHFFAD